jgi:hypothetical protein
MPPRSRLKAFGKLELSRKSPPFGKSSESPSAGHKITRNWVLINHHSANLSQPDPDNLFRRTRLVGKRGFVKPPEGLEPAFSRRSGDIHLGSLGYVVSATGSIRDSKLGRRFSANQWLATPTNSACRRA